MKNLKTLFLTFVVMLMGALSFSCSENVSTEPVISGTAETYTVCAPVQSRVFNYGGVATRSSEALADIPAAPSIPSDVKDFPKDNPWDISGNVVVKSGEVVEIDGMKFSADANVYVEGTLYVKNTLTFDNAGKYNIYVMPTGTFQYSVSEYDYKTFNSGLVLYNYGELVFPGNITVGEGSTIYSVNSIEAGGFGLDGTLVSKSSIVADDVRLNGTAIACSFIAENSIQLNDKGTIYASYFKSKKIEMNGAQIVLDDNGLMYAVDGLFISNADTRISVDGTIGIVSSPKLSTNNVTWAKNTFLAGIVVDFEKTYIGGTEVPKNQFEFTTSTDDISITIPSGRCHPAFQTGVGELEEDPIVKEPEIIIEKIADIEGLEPDHEHGHISATCVNFADGVAYVSYHLRGEGDKINPIYPGIAQKGCVEAIYTNGETISLGNYMISPSYDFNHLIVDGDSIVVVGNHERKGAFIGKLPISFASSETANRSDFRVKELTTDDPIYLPSSKDPEKNILNGYQNAGDGNCILKQDGKYLVATFEGYGVIDVYMNREKGTFVKTSGSSKHIASANGNTGVISLTSRKTDSSQAVVEIYDGPLFSGIPKSYLLSNEVKPIDGKNVLLLDGNDIYACLSHGGLVRVNDSKEFKKNNIPVNGIAADAKYLYVAMGSFVYVLNKVDMSPVTYYHAANEKSANYIALENNLIYVAFGENGLQVFKLVEK